MTGSRPYRLVLRENDRTLLDISDVRCSFIVEKSMICDANACEVTLFNLPANLQNVECGESAAMELWAGSSVSGLGKVFSGEVYDLLRGKLNGTRMLTIQALDGDSYLTGGTVNLSVAKGVSHFNMLRMCTKEASSPAGMGFISERTKDTCLARGKVMCGKAIDEVRLIARSQNAQYYIEDNQLHFLCPADVVGVAAVTLTADNGLQQAPEYAQNGVFAQALLRSDLRVGAVVRIDNTGQNALLGRDTLFRMTKVVHCGDTQGALWQTKLWGLEQVGSTLTMLNTVDNPWR